MQFAERLVMKIKNEQQSIQFATEITPQDFMLHFREQQQQPLSIDEIKLIERQKAKLKTKTAREEQKDIRLSQSTLTLAAEMKEKNEQAAQLAKETINKELLQCYQSLNPHNKKELMEILNPEVKSDQFKEQLVYALLKNMGMLEKTAKGYKVSLVGTTHRDHDGLIDAHFITNLRNYFKEHNVTLQTLEGLEISQQIKNPA